jgi:hypothetical protein
LAGDLRWPEGIDHKRPSAGVGLNRHQECQAAVVHLNGRLRTTTVAPLDRVISTMSNSRWWADRHRNRRHRYPGDEARAGRATAGLLARVRRCGPRACGVRKSTPSRMFPMLRAARATLTDRGEFVRRPGPFNSRRRSSTAGPQSDLDLRRREHGASLEIRAGMDATMIRGWPARRIPLTLVVEECLSSSRSTLAL